MSRSRFPSSRPGRLPPLPAGPASWRECKVLWLQQTKLAWKEIRKHVTYEMENQQTKSEKHNRVKHSGEEENVMTFVKTFTSQSVKDNQLGSPINILAQTCRNFRAWVRTCPGWEPDLYRHYL
ncbi:hypothetical protein RRG08_058650 [Elysia crispata]|uniref:Uncharacterized protein n=1 Tax=Elysia crispata TaxID=231223 RepID=A0AAE1D7X9_9GAST|nr:hypothetical protein RRG08_058650 [Elysia crispata]